VRSWDSSDSTLRGYVGAPQPREPQSQSRSFCGIELGKADGKLPPGRDTDEELQEAVRAAGYEWVPAEP
jgi:hypothetical protein